MISLVNGTDARESLNSGKSNENSVKSNSEKIKAMRTDSLHGQVVNFTHFTEFIENLLAS